MASAAGHKRRKLPAGKTPSVRSFSVRESRIEAALILLKIILKGIFQIRFLCQEIRFRCPRRNGKSAILSPKDDLSFVVLCLCFLTLDVEYLLDVIMFVSVA